MKRSGLLLAVLFSIFPPWVLGDDLSESDRQLGERLVREIWAEMKSADMSAIEKRLADGFQAIHQFGASGREDEKALISELDLGEYEISGLRITRNGPVIVATYEIAVAETIEGKRLMKEPTPRMSVFLKTAAGWQWIAHANPRALSRSQ